MQDTVKLFVGTSDHHDDLAQKIYLYTLYKKACTPYDWHKDAFKIAIGMSFISMVAMELAMNITDVLLTGGAKLTWWVIPFMLLAGFITPLPYNYYRLKKWNKACH